MGFKLINQKHLQGVQTCTTDDVLTHANDKCETWLRVGIELY